MIVLSALLICVYIFVVDSNSNISAVETVNAESFTSFSSCKASPRSTGKTIIVSSRMKVNNCTVPADRTVRLDTNGVLDISTGNTLVINGPLYAGMHQIFAGGGKVKFGLRNVKEVYPQWWGAKGDGRFDSTAALQAALNIAGKVVIPDGDYFVSPSKQDWYHDALVLSSNTELVFGPKARLFLASNSYQNAGILQLNQISNVKIHGGILIGDRDTHSGSSGEFGFGVNIHGGKNINIENLTSNNNWGDGLYIGSTGLHGSTPDTIEIINFKADNNRRQGISLTSGKNIRIVNAIITNTNGTMPQSGIDLEPNFHTDKLSNIKISNLKTSNNAGFGIIVSPGQLTSESVPVDIIIENHHSTGDRVSQGFIAAKPNSVRGRIRSTDLYSEKAGLNGIVSNKWAAVGTPKVEIHRPVVFDSNESSNRSLYYGSGILLYQESSGTYEIGNIDIYDPTVIDRRPKPKMPVGIYAQDNRSAGIHETSFNIYGKLNISGAQRSPVVWKSKGANKK
jgi:hypothetical protein